MGIWGQIAGAVKSGLGAALAPAVDPRATYVSAHQKQQALLLEVGLAVDQVGASKRRLQQRATEDRGRLPEMLEEARAELVAGHQDAARVALKRRQAVALELSALELQLAEVEKDEANLNLLQRRLANQVDEFVARQQMIMARYNAAEAQVRIKEAVTGVSKDFAAFSAALEEAEEKTDGLEARASAIDRLVHEGMLGPSSLDSSARLGGADADVETQLAVLQKEIAAS